MLSLAILIPLYFYHQLKDKNKNKIGYSVSLSYLFNNYKIISYPFDTWL